MPRPWLRTTLAVGVVISLATLAVAHGGGLDSQGGHNDRSAGTYHFHRGALAGRSFSSKSAAATALRKHNAAAASTADDKAADNDPKRVLTRATTAKKVDALIAVLVRKGSVTERELAAELKKR